HTALSTKVNWYFKLANGKRVVGPMVLFNSQLFFGTFVGGSVSNPCDIGTSEIWGMDYLRPLGNSTSVLNAGGDAFIVPPATTANQLILTVPSAVAYGPALTQKPTCAVDVDTLLGDGLVGFGHQVSLSNIQSGTFQLVIGTGSQQTGSTGNGTSIGVRTVDLATPPALSSVSAWASIME
ncbi:MAG TPA: hypothetical protein VNN72_08460, partial [Polyangiaceae bacterium]|nr:hypothetical protein [Polyangiaceae bacterium]